MNKKRYIIYIYLTNFCRAQWGVTTQMQLGLTKSKGPIKKQSLNIHKIKCMDILQHRLKKVVGQHLTTELSKQSVKKKTITNK